MYVNISVHKSTVIAHANLLVNPQHIRGHKTTWTGQVDVCGSAERALSLKTSVQACLV